VKIDRRTPVVVYSEEGDLTFLPNHNKTATPGFAPYHICVDFVKQQKNSKVYNTFYVCTTHLYTHHVISPISLHGVEPCRNKHSLL
jgi:hypothetical protein